MNASNINFSLSPTKFLQPLSLAIFITLSLFHLLAVPALHLVSPFLARQPSHRTSQIAHLDTNHLVFGINFQIHFVSLASHVSIHLFIHLSIHLCSHPHSQHSSLLHFFTPGSKPTFSANPSHLNRRLSPHWTACTTMGLDRTYHAHQIILSFSVYFFVYFV